MVDLLCPWTAPEFLIFSENVPKLFYYSHGVAILTALFFGFFIFIKDRKSLLNRLLFIIVSLFSVWTFLDLAIWASNSPSFVMFWWSVIIFVEVLIFVYVLYFLHVFIEKKDVLFPKKLLFFIALLPLFILIPTEYSLLGVDLSTCSATESPVIIYYTYIFEILIVFLLLHFSFKKHEQLKDVKSKKEIFSVTFGSMLFLLAFSYGNIIGSITENWELAQYGLFGMPIFIGFMAYMIVRFKTFAVKLLGAQALVVTLWVLIGSMLLIVQGGASRAIVIFTLVLSVLFGIFLIRSVKKEVTQREEIEKLAVDLKNTNNNLEHANDRLKELDKQKTEFVSFATHQLRSPLTAMKGYSSLILEGDYGEISPDLRDAVQKIHESTNTLTTVVNDYLNISRIELGTMKYDFKPLDLKDVVKEVIGELQPNIDKAGIKFSFEVDARAKYLAKIDIDKFKQVLANIIDNSIKYTPAGSIVASVKKDTAKNTVTFAVKDTGIGMAEGVIPKLFAKFSRAENANKVNIRGTGLGLFVAKEIVKAHGGKVWAESEGEGKGSQFYVELPAEK